MTRPPLTCALLDLDDTLYDCPAMQRHVADNIRSYMAERLGVPPDEVASLCAEYYLNYGTTLAGLVAHGHTIDFDDWHAAVHGSLPYEEYIKPDPALRRLLLSLDTQLPLYIFTNADDRHAARCLDLLGVADCFRGVITFETVMAAAAQEGLVHHGVPVVCKPNRQAFEVALRLVGGGLRAPATLWLDDSARNIATGHKLGMCSVLVGRTGVACPADYQIRSIHDLPAALPWLWEQQQPGGPQPPPPAASPLEDPAAAAAAVVAEGDGDGGVEAAMLAALKGKRRGVVSSAEGEGATIEAVYVAA